jgi:hypothetical protein
LCNRTAEHLWLEVVGETPPTVDLDDREPLPILGFERGVTADVDLGQREGELGLERTNLVEHTLAEMAALRVVDDDVRAVTGRCHA